MTREGLETLRHADAIFLEEIRAAGLYDAIWQAFAVLLPVRTVGVMGDGRTYDQACALRAVTSTDGMTAEFYPFDMGFLGRVAGRIVGEVRGINRVTYDITSKPPGRSSGSEPAVATGRAWPDAMSLNRMEMHDGRSASRVVFRLEPSG